MNNKEIQTVAVMQPYIFPYIGYFQLIHASDVFVFYDDVNFIKRGWINRNRILNDGEDKLISFPCVKASQNKLINEVSVDTSQKSYKKIITTIKQSYKKATFYKDVMPIIEAVLTKKYSSISELATNSIIAVLDYLNLENNTLLSSEHFSETKGMEKADRLIHITKSFNAPNYVNALGGKSLYTKEFFKDKDVNLNFLDHNLKPYSQFNANFIPGLSIIDVLMFNSKEETIQLIKDYELQ